jgi:hypothetical protein
VKDGIANELEAKLFGIPSYGIAGGGHTDGNMVEDVVLLLELTNSMLSIAHV